MAKQYLKDIVALAGGTLMARMETIGDVKLNKNSKQYRPVKFVFPATGASMEDNVYEWVFKDSLQGAQQGSMVEITLKDNWPVFKLLSATAETATVQPTQSSFQQVKSERAATEAINEREEKEAVRDWKLGLAGITQSMLICGKTAEEITGKELTGSPTAEQWARWIRQKAHSMHMGITLPVPATSIEEVEAAFGEVPPPASLSDYQ